MNLIGRFRNSLAQRISTANTRNLFAESFYKFLGGVFTAYDKKAKTYLEKGYGTNPDVYAVIQQMSVKTASVPYYVKKIKDEDSMKNLKRLEFSTKGDMSIAQKVKAKIYETKAMGTEKPFPLDRPNPTQTWSEFWSLCKTFFRTTGNVYIYMVTPGDDSINVGVPLQVYILPSHMTQIILKKGIDLLGIESPIDHYILTEGDKYIKFPAQDVIHIKTPNPFFDMNGSHLYGLSPLRAALVNVQSTNEGLQNNVKTMKNGGAFGLIHGKGMPLNPEQAKQIKDRLVEMDKSPERLSKIAGVSSEVGFIRIALNTDELKPFDYMKYDQKQICNVLGWSDALLNNDDGGKYDKQQKELTRVVTDNIMPDLRIFEEAMNTYFLPRFKGYEGYVMRWDASELPEMQTDMEKLVNWMKELKDRGIITSEEFRLSINYPESGNPLLSEYTVTMKTERLEDALNLNSEIDRVFRLDTEEDE